MRLTTARAAASEPAPVPGGDVVLKYILPDVVAVAGQHVADACVVRGEFGEIKYSRPLETNNGRDAAMDWLREGFDGVGYGGQLHMELDESDSPNAAEALQLWIEWMRLTAKLEDFTERLLLEEEL